MNDVNDVSVMLAAPSSQPSTASWQPNSTSNLTSLFWQKLNDGLSSFGDTANTYSGEEAAEGVQSGADPPYSLTAAVVLAIVVGLLALLTIAGNTLVVVSFATDRKLRSFGNYFILNLAISDLIVGLLIVVYAPYLLRGCWHLTRLGCLSFLLLDYVVPLASAWNMALISLDRYCSVARPIEYRLRLNTRRAVALMCVPWIAGALWYGPTVLFWEHLAYWIRTLWMSVGSADQNATSDDVMLTAPSDVVAPSTCPKCDVEFFDNPVYLFVSSLVEFIIPFVTVATINILIYANIRRRSRGMTSSSSTSASTGSSTSCAVAPDSASGQKSAKAKSLLSRDKKSARSLAILVVVFLVTWGPFEVCALFNPLCGFCVPQSALDIVFWLLWLNSAINPVLYPFLQQRFRVAFIRVLCRFRPRRTGGRLPPVSVYVARTVGDIDDRSGRGMGATSNASPSPENRGIPSTTRL